MRRTRSCPVRFAAYPATMSANELIEQIKALPAAERRVVVDFVKELDQQPSNAAASRRERFENAADTVFRKHHEALRRLAQ
jgi:hypothetical protein